MFSIVMPTWVCEKNNFNIFIDFSQLSTTAHICISDDIVLAMDHREATILSLLDISKAFDCVNYSVFLLKLQRNGLSS